MVGSFDGGFVSRTTKARIIGAEKGRADKIWYPYRQIRCPGSTEHGFWLTKVVPLDQLEATTGWVVARKILEKSAFSVWQNVLSMLNSTGRPVYTGTGWQRYALVLPFWEPRRERMPHFLEKRKPDFQSFLVPNDPAFSTRLVTYKPGHSVKSLFVETSFWWRGDLL